MGQAGGFLAGLAALIGALKGWRDSRRVRGAGRAGAEAQQTTLMSTNAGLTDDSRVGDIHFKVSNIKLLLRLIVSIALAVGVVAGVIAWDANTRDLPDEFGYAALTIAGFFGLVAMVCILRLAYRFLLYVFLR